VGLGCESGGAPATHHAPLSTQRGSRTHARTHASTHARMHARARRYTRTHARTFLRILPRIWHSRVLPSKQYASRRPLPSMRVTLPYSAGGCGGGGVPTGMGGGRPQRPRGGPHRARDSGNRLIGRIHEPRPARFPMRSVEALAPTQRTLPLLLDVQLALLVAIVLAAAAALAALACELVCTRGRVRTQNAEAGRMRRPRATRSAAARRRAGPSPLFFGIVCGGGW
jgi:hypothetical protein